MSGVHLILSYSGGVVTSVTDGNGRIAYMSYESGFLTSMTNAAGDIVNFAYDKNGRMISSTVMGEETPYVENVYDNNNRVVKQYDALGNVSKFSYAKDKNESLTVSATDRNGNNVVFTSDSMGRVCSIIDANYHETSYVYDIRGNLLSETNSKGDSRRYEYDADNNLIKLYDYYGNVTEMSYDSYGNVTEVDGSLGEHSSYTYNPHNLLASVAENSGIRKTYTYNKNNQILTESTTGLGVIYYEYENGRLVSLTDYNGNKKFLTYDDMGNLHSETDFNGNETVYEYDALGRVTGITTEDGVVSYIYDSRGNKTSATDANGNTIYMYYNGNNKVIRTVDAVNAETIFEYDNEDRLLKTTYADGTSDTNTYDAAGNLTRTVNANNEITEYEYDEVDQVVSVTTIDEKNKHTISYSYYPDGKLKCTTYADGSSETYTYDKAGRTTSITDQLGNTIVMAYDNSGNLISSSDAEGNTTKYTYDIYGRVLTAIDPNGNVTSYDKYDANGNCLQMTYPNGLIFSYEYDKNGQIIKAVTGDISVLYEYDASGRVKKYTDEENHVYTFSYDANGNVTQMTDANGNVIAENQYDAVNNLIMTTDALGIQTEYTYNNVGQLKKVIESINTARQAETIYNYDNIGQLTDVTDAENGTASYEYDGFGNIISMTDPNGGKTTYTYDSMGRILESLNAVGSKNSYTYNAQGLLDSAVNARGQETSYTYYKNGWIKSFADELGTVSYTYDSNGNVLTVKDDNGTITREYNEMNQVTKYTDFRGNTVSYGYDELGNLVTITYPGGRIVRYSYYKNGSIKTVTDWNNQITSYEYDGNGRLTKTSRPDGSVETRSYDAAGRLIKQVDAVGNKTINARDYAYDESGNIVSASMSNGTEFSGLTNAEMEYDEVNRLIKYNGVDVEYDADGNMIYGPLNGVMTELVYDCRNRLISAGGITYEYDAENNRISKTSSNTKTSYTVDTSGSLSRILTVEKDGKTTYYVYGIGLVSQEDDTRTLYYHFSNIGSTEAITDIDGNIVETFEYGPYGELISSNKCGIIFLYNGEYGVSADENGLYYMRARYYSPEIKRFINQDVVIGTIADSPSMNRYAYVQGNPISYVDPFGLSPGLGWKFWAHTGLSLLGGLMAIPTPITMIIGAATIINTAWYAAEGDYFSAICSGISVFGCGFQALSAAKAAGSISISCKFITALKYASCVSEIAVATYDMVQIGNEMYNLAANGELTLGKVLGSTFNVVMDAVSIGNSVNMLSQKVSYCFVAGTLVETDEGQKPIEDIKVGDKVLSEDVETGEVAYKTVLETYENETTELVHVHVNGEEITATPNHPFYVDKLGWTLAKNLRAGDVLVLSNGEFVVIEWIQHEILESPVKVYNFEVEDFHTYFVGESSVLVHNMCKTSDSGEIFLDQEKTRESARNTLGHL